jgi:hypothetical protein
MVGIEVERIVQEALTDRIMIDSEFVTDDAIIGKDLLLDGEDIGDLMDCLESNLGIRFPEQLDMDPFLTFSVKQLKFVIVMKVLGVE